MGSGYLRIMLKNLCRGITRGNEVQDRIKWNSCTFKHRTSTGSARMYFNILVSHHNRSNNALWMNSPDLSTSDRSFIASTYSWPIKYLSLSNLVYLEPGLEAAQDLAVGTLVPGNLCHVARFLECTVSRAQYKVKGTDGKK